MKINSLLDLASEMPLYHSLIEELEQPNGIASTSIIDAAKPYIIAAIYKTIGLPVFLITAQPKKSRTFQEQITIWANRLAVLFPEPIALPYQDVISDNSMIIEQLQVLTLLANSKQRMEEPPLVIVSAPAIMRKIVDLNHFISAWHTVKVGMDIEPLSLIHRWQKMGYKLEYVVETPGFISHRGGIVDIYPPTSELPTRLEFFGNTIDSIRFFDRVSQRSLNAIQQITVGPASEMIMISPDDRLEFEKVIHNIDCNNCNNSTKQKFQKDLGILLEGHLPENTEFYAQLLNSGSILDYLPSQSLVILDEPMSIQETLEALDAQAREFLDYKLKRGDLPCNLPRPYFTWTEIVSKLNIHKRLLFSWGFPSEGKVDQQLNFTNASSYAGRLSEFIEKGKQLLKQKNRIILISHQANRLTELLAEKDIAVEPVTELEKAPLPGSLVLVQGILDQGWVMNNSVHLFGDNEIFGFIKQGRLLKQRPAARIKSLGEITPGDFVVHIEHGIARFAGVTLLRNDNIEREYLLLQYSAGDRLYVPVDQMDRINRYIGGGDRSPILNRLGTQEWEKSKQKAKESAEGIAQELLTLYADRQAMHGFTFSTDTVWQQELEASFPYMETPDQITVQEIVKSDMMKSKPMDRLVCGDVGFGKTEVAIRAAFKAVMDYKQVVLLVPTTVLAQQHFFSFKQRLGAFPIKVEVISRFRNPVEQEQIKEGLVSGCIDICIGTHRLLQKDIVFKDLGLLIIDEEQRFGVHHKEYFKKVRQQIDVLSLSATPIPRTLQMSLAGVRDMSIMETPPSERLPIKTYVTQYDKRLIREAIIMEIERNGQVFFVHNRVHSIIYAANELRLLVPEAKIAVAHGRMAEMELEKVMVDFTRGNIDVLVCTTIIESGLDIPNANTLIVNQADNFGLTQLYQLRGRIGRGNNMAYAYFFYSMGKRLTPDAQKRLKTIFEATELGAGFDIAMKDLEIRGAGNLLGTKQSGHITAVGFNLYTRLLNEAVEEVKTKKTHKLVDKTKYPIPPIITLPLPAYIPENYISDVNSRLMFYQRLVEVKNEEQLEVLKYDFKDRFGSLPQEVEDLLYCVKIKLMGMRIGVESVSTKGNQIVIILFSGINIDKERLNLIFRNKIKCGLNNLYLDYMKLGNKWKDILEEVIRVI